MYGQLFSVIKVIGLFMGVTLAFPSAYIYIDAILVIARVLHPALRNCLAF